MGSPESEVPPETDLRILSVSGIQVSAEESGVALSGISAVNSGTGQGIRGRSDVEALGPREVWTDVEACVLSVSIENARAHLSVAKDALAVARKEAGLSPQEVIEPEHVEH